MVCVLIRIASASTHKISLEIIPNTIMSAAMGFPLLRNQERVQNSHGKGAISVRATEFLLYISFTFPAFYERAEIKQDEGKPKHLVVALTSDRGLCGGVHSSICKTIKSDLEEKAGAETKLVLIGDKAKAQLQKYVQFFYQSDPEVIKLCSCSTQLSMKF